MLAMRSPNVHNSSVAGAVAGDPYQQIYGFNNSANALQEAAVTAAELGVPVKRFALSQSFRFGPAVAEVANR